MDILLKGVTIIDPSSPHHQQTLDVFIQNNFITEIGSLTNKSDQELSLQDVFISPGWIDLFAQFCDPGMEAQETLETGALAAAYGGYTDVCLIPNTSPVTDNKSAISYVIQKSKPLPVYLHPLGSITKNCAGKELAEMYDLKNAGAIGFTDGLNSLQSAGVLLKALQYLKATRSTIIQIPDDYSISAQGLMNEGIVSTQLGLPGKPAMAEEIMLMRDIELAKYTASKIHFTGVSTAAGVALIKQAKKDGIAITCSCTPYHLLFSDNDLRSYDTNLKVSPPLRTEADKLALQIAVQEGVIDCIASHHLPEHSDHKITEFEYAKPGMISLETVFSVVRTAMPSLSIQEIILLLTNARKIVEQPSLTIKAGAQASISVFQPNTEWIPGPFYSKSRNTPLTGKKLLGKPLGIINKEKLFLRPQ